MVLSLGLFPHLESRSSMGIPGGAVVGTRPFHYKGAQV